MVDTTTSEGREEFSGPKNHSRNDGDPYKIAAELVMLVEHAREKLPPGRLLIAGRDGEMVTDPISTKY